MRMDRLTTMAQQALADAQSEAMARSNPEVTGLHILHALLKEKGGAAWSILDKAGGGAARVASIAESEIKRLPTVSGGQAQAGRAVMEILTRAERGSPRSWGMSTRQRSICCWRWRR